MNWLHYLLEANIYLAVFYAGYCLFLNKETHYTLNRVYLLMSCIIAFILPIIQIGALKPAGGGMAVHVTIKRAGTRPVNNLSIRMINFNEILFYCYLLGGLILTIVLIYKLTRLIKMAKKANIIVDNRYKMININDSNTAFSFFNYLFIGSNTAVNDMIIRHELVHIRQKHSADIIFLEILKIVNWFNPCVYLLQNSLKTIHEYIADEQTAAHGNDVLAYSSFLVNNAYGLNGSSVTHSFFNYNLLKKRIIMLNQKRSGNLARLKYLVAVPICVAALCASTLGFSKNYALIDLSPQKLVDTSKVWSKSTDTKNGVKIDETGSVVNNRTDFEVTITDKQGNKKSYRKSTASAEDIKLLRDKYGYTFPDKMDVPAPPSKIGNMPPPPPPVPPKSSKSALKVKRDVRVTDVKLLQPPPPPQEPAEPAKDATEQKMPPPPPPPKDPLDDFYSYVAKHVRYPTVARDNHVAGKIIASFNINKGKIEDAKIVRGLDNVMDNEVLRVIKNYNGTSLNLKGNYLIPVTYTLVDQNNNQVGKAPNYQAQSIDKSNDIKVESGSRQMLNEVIIAGYADTK
ncbi:M56 family metallopeptidase [Mucilaginibacter aquaedulcis]|uniref:M56 family metallopeptidase n=1 Tax=Mucilaginibacter aquaedulcis TaxID=1187081 RepID=UPI0025B5C6FB|nr:M56 family metallopeptidase [Mucilaginibacter aquaedulcis]MDN3549017.1 M56 family metallopeptidase [Mucilaginibacter aquaedulcis]